MAFQYLKPLQGMHYSLHYINVGTLCTGHVNSYVLHYKLPYHLYLIVFLHLNERALKRLISE